ncbi:unnamed protein product [Lactuca virosa]|uniref:DUF4283 domain-containing protein n=1 Tax=Lactuca virosa TaxID=75947 RepID=A0AAU9M1R1_9ASTR|nr:unnamed protein product [Lactuca virosa]
MSDNTKYLGGLRMAIKFGHSREERKFLEDKNRWQDWFKWMILPDQHLLQYERRTAWIKILGLPLRLWEEENFTMIAGSLGKVIAPFNEISKRRDYSMGKVGILTSRTKWINEEVTIIADGKIIIVGVMEYTDDWSPFRPLPFDKVEEESDKDEIDVDEDDDEVEGVSDTWMGEYNNSKKEDGEFWPEDNYVDPPVMNDTVAEESPMVETERDRSRTPNSTPLKGHELETGNKSNNVELWIRKRKRIKCATKSPHSTTPSTPIINCCLSQLEHMAHTNSGYASTKPVEMSVSDTLEPDEAKRTVEIGAELGFQIEVDSRILEQVIGETGVQQNIP